MATGCRLRAPGLRDLVRQADGRALTIMLNWSLARSVFNGITTFPHWTGLHKEPIPTVVLPTDGDLSDLSEEEEPEDEEEDLGRTSRRTGIDTMGRPVTKRSGSGRRGEISPLLKNVGE